MRMSHARQLNEIEFALGEFVAEFDPNAVPLCEATAMWRRAVQAARFADSIAMLLAPRVDEAREWKRKGYRTAADMLASDAGTTVASARSMLETSKRVTEQRKTEQALRAGDLSVTNAELVAAAIEVAPEQADT